MALYKVQLIRTAFDRNCPGSNSPRSAPDRGAERPDRLDGNSIRSHRAERTTGRRKQHAQRHAVGCGMPRPQYRTGKPGARRRIGLSGSGNNSGRRTRTRAEHREQERVGSIRRPFAGAHGARKTQNPDRCAHALRGRAVRPAGACRPRYREVVRGVLAVARRVPGGAIVRVRPVLAGPAAIFPGQVRGAVARREGTSANGAGAVRRRRPPGFRGPGSCPHSCSPGPRGAGPVRSARSAVLRSWGWGAEWTEVVSRAAWHYSFGNEGIDEKVRKKIFRCGSARRQQPFRRQRLMRLRQERPRWKQRQRAVRYA